MSLSPLKVPHHAPPVTLTIAGSDCSAGAGIQADLKAFNSLGVYGLTAITGVVAESPLTVANFNAVSPELLTDQLECLAEAYPIAVVKTGLLFTPALVAVVAKFIKKHRLPLIIDPICIASTGTSFTTGDILWSYRETLIPLASLVTPNLKEAQALADSTDKTQSALARTLWNRYQVPFLVKGGHSADLETSIDYLIAEGEITEFPTARLNVPDLHGTGCVLSSAIASHLAKGVDLQLAISCAKEFITNSMLTHITWGETKALNLFPAE